MAAQPLPLFDDVPRKLTIDDKFSEWCAMNPHVVRLCLQYAREAKAAGRTRYGIAAIFERVRWHVNVQIKSKDEFRVNNDFRAPMARLIVAMDPTLREMFAFRKRKAS